MRSDNKYNPTLRGLGELALPNPPQAVIQIVLQAGGEVAVAMQGPPNLFIIEGMLGAARALILEKLEKAKQGPQVEVAPAGILIN